MGPNKGKDGGVWTRIEPVEERSGDSASERSVRGRQSDEEIGVAVGGGDGGSQDGIWQTTTITHEVERREGERDRRGNSWLE